MKVIDFIEQLQKHNPSKQVIFTLCQNENVFLRIDFNKAVPILFEVIGEANRASAKNEKTLEEVWQNDVPVLICLAPVKEEPNEEKKEKP